MEKEKEAKKKEERKREDNKIKKEEVCEIFKVEDGEEKEIKTCGIEETKAISKNQIKKENKILKNFFIWLGIVVLFFMLIIFIIYATSHFEIGGITFNVIKDTGGLIFYHTSFPIVYDGKNTIYNVYIRNDPRKLEEIPFNGELNLREMMVINNTEEFVCEGKGGIAMINLKQIFEIFGTTLMKDPNATCDSQGRYMFVKIQSGDVTNIEQTGPTCYNLNINNCEILKVTERFIIEMLTKYKIIV